MLSRRFAPLFVFAVALVLVSGCVSLPVSGSSEGTGTPGVPVVREETASVPPTAVVTEQATPQPTATRAVGEPTAGATLAPDATLAPSATAALTTTQTVQETPAPATIAAPAATSAPGAALEVYRGPNPYRATPAFEVAYDPAVWEYAADDGSGRLSQLKHRTLAGCAIWLRAGPVDAQEMGQSFLAERVWSVAEVQPKVIQYASKQGDVGFVFGILLNEEYTGMANSNCQDAAEQVINTFKVVAE